MERDDEVESTNILINEEDILNEPIVYEVIRIINKKPLFLNEHLLRMKNSIKFFSKIEFNEELCKERILKIIKDEKIINQNIRMETGNFIKGSFLYKIFKIESNYPSNNEYSNGVNAITVHIERNNPEIKIRNDEYKNNIKKELDKNNAYEAILTDCDGKILEGSRSNLFFVKDNKIITSKSGDVLEGITLSNVLKVINKEKIEMIRRDIYKDEIKSFDGAFLTGTSIDILPIGKINDLKLKTATNPLVLNLINKFDIFKKKDMRRI